MKKKVLCLILAVTITIQLAGCGFTDWITDLALGNEYGQEASSQEESVEGTTDASGTESSNQDYQNKLVDDGLNYVSPEPDNSVIFGFDDDGNLVASYDLSSVSSETEESDIKLNKWDAKFVNDGIIYYQVTSSDTIKDKLVAYNFETKEIKDVTDWEDKTSFGSIGIVDGRLYVTASTSDSREVRCYELRKDGKGYEKISVPEEDFFDGIKEYGIQTDINMGIHRSYKEILDDYGFLIGRKDKEYFFLRKDQAPEKIEELSGSIFGYDDKGIIYYDYSDDEPKTLIYNVESGESIALPKDYPDDYFYQFGISDGVIYYSAVNSDEFGVDNYTYYAFDILTGTKTALLQMSDVPGTQTYIPGEGFTVIGQKAYYSKFKEGKALMFVADITEEGLINEKETGAQLQDYEVFNYGEVKYISNSNYCEAHNLPVDQCYAEYVVFDGDKVQNADAINEALYNYANEFAHQHDDADEKFTPDCDEEHENYPAQYNETDEETITKAGIIDDRYVYVNYDGYWYGGGAHGMPYRQQYLFDMTTGQEMSFADFYEESEDDFKKLIATKVKEDYEKYEKEGEGTPYFADSADAAYDSAYEQCGFEGTIEFTEDGIIYAFAPYELSSYAAGFMEYYVTYKEVFGRDTLSN